MKHVISIDYRRPRESGGPGQPFESCGPWVPAFAGMTDKRLILQESLRFRLLGMICTQSDVEMLRVIPQPVLTGRASSADPVRNTARRHGTFLLSGGASHLD